MKEQICNAYIQLSLEKKTTRISVRQLCKHTNISRTTFYKYFKDCNDITEYIFMKDVLEPIEVLIKNGIDRRIIIENWYLNFYKNKDFFALAIKDDNQNSLFYTIVNKLTNYEMKIFPKRLKGEMREYYTYKYAAMQAMLTKKWLLEGMKVSPQKMAECFYEDIVG